MRSRTFDRVLLSLFAMIGLTRCGHNGFDPPDPTPPHAYIPDPIVSGPPTATPPGSSGGYGSGAAAAGTGSDTSGCLQAAMPGDGHHNAGLDCLTCHNGTTAPHWTVAGTLYSDVSGSAPIPGATIEIVDATGQVLRLVTATNGNFHTTQAVTFPIHPRASLCPADVHMATGAPHGSCNTCHNSSFRLHL